MAYWAAASFKASKASEASNAAPSAITESSNIALFEWLVEAVLGSIQSGQAPMKTKAPGMMSTIDAKSSPPAIGSGMFQ